MEIIKHLGKKLAVQVSISPAAARGLLKLAVKDKFGPFQPLETLDFNDYKKIIQETLKTRLDKIKDSDNKVIIDSLLNELIKNQSLISLGEI